MNKILSAVLFMFIASTATAQVVGSVDKKTKELDISSSQKNEYKVFGYEFAGTSMKKMICFSSHESDVRANYNNCPLGSYYGTDRLRNGDKILYLGPAGKLFGKMVYASGSGKKTIFYLPKSSFVIK
ncbi:MAG: hypothetical protein JST47_11930 [Bacteroidetes bacterium]|nr:hypothetical protein [Bacteroidota bacterium]